jgi:hypothetical protein
LPTPEQGISVYDDRAIAWVIDGPLAQASPEQPQQEVVVIPEEDRLFDEDTENEHSGHGSITVVNDPQSTTQQLNSTNALEDTLEDIQPTQQNSLAMSTAEDANTIRRLRHALVEFQESINGILSIGARSEALSSRLEPFTPGFHQSIVELRTEVRNIRRPVQNARRALNMATQSESRNEESRLQRRLRASPTVALSNQRPYFGSQNVATMNTRTSTTDSRQSVERMSRVWGSREDVQQPNYQSPISGMFERHYQRYRDAEERRREEAALQTTQIIQQSLPEEQEEPLDRVQQRLRERMQADTSQINNPLTSNNQQNMYPDSREPPEPLESHQMNIRLSCVICRGQIASIALIPCGHLAMCVWCSHNHSRTDLPLPENRHMANYCPICRTFIVKRLRVYIPGDQQIQVEQEQSQDLEIKQDELAEQEVGENIQQ